MYSLKMNLDSLEAFITSTTYVANIKKNLFHLPSRYCTVHSCSSVVEEMCVPRFKKKKVKNEGA
jgi:hypothetical protein